MTRMDKKIEKRVICPWICIHFLRKWRLTLTNWGKESKLSTGTWTSTTTAENQPGAGKSGARLAHTGMHLLALLHKRENLTQNVKNSPGKPQKMLDETRHSHRDQRRMLKSKICSTKFEIEKLIFINSLMLKHCSLLLTLSLCCLFCHPQQ